MTFLDTPVPTVFISYSHADEEWKERLAKHLNVLAEHQGFEVWDDRQIGAGDDWEAQIKRALAAASVAVLLVSVDFLSSRYVRGKEIPALLSRREQDKLPIVPVLLRACPWPAIPWLAGMQMRPKNARPLAEIASHEVEGHLTVIATEIAAKVSQAVAVAAKPLPARAPEVVPASRAPVREPAPVVAQPQVPLSGVPLKVPRPPAPSQRPGRFPPIKVAASVVGIAVVVLLAIWLGSVLLGWLRSRPENLPTPATAVATAPPAITPSSSPTTRPSPTPAVAVTTLPTPDPASLPVAPPGVTLTPISFQSVRVGARGAIVERRRGQTRGFSEDVGGGVRLDMIAIPGGKFLMGSPATEADRSAGEGSQADVAVAPVFMGQFEVTQAQWRAVATTCPRVERELAPDPAHFKGDDRPVEQVSWHDAVEFCKRLSKKTGRDYRLPSEAEWEYAARAGTQTPFAFGLTITPDLVNYQGTGPYGAAPKGLSRTQTTKVGELGVANACGLFDVHGNVWEWVQDVWHGNYAGRPTDGRAWETGGEPTRRVLRGGSWLNYAGLCRSAVRNGAAPELRYYDWGFRVACAVSRTQ